MVETTCEGVLKDYVGSSLKGPLGSFDHGSHKHIRILQTMVSGIPLVLALRTNMQDPSVVLAAGALTLAALHTICR